MSKTINVLITIDTDRVGKIQNPSQDPNKPTGIGHELDLIEDIGEGRPRLVGHRLLLAFEGVRVEKSV